MTVLRTHGHLYQLHAGTIMLLHPHQGQVLWNELGGNLSRFNPAVQHYLQGLHLRPDDPKAIALMAQQVAEQAEMLAMIDIFQLITWSFVLMLPLVFLLRKRQNAEGPIPVAAE